MKRKLKAWQAYQATMYKQKIQLGLDRVKTVAERLNVLKPSCPIIIVGGTNGKGSSVAVLENIYHCAGFKTGAFTSPYLFNLNEEFRFNKKTVSDEELILAFEKIEMARADILLTPFEFNTLAALLLFKEKQVEVGLLEVGLGGRLDAVNIIDADAALITSIDIDHVDWLGDTREKIAFEKSGIFRKHQFAICADSNPPQTLLQHAESIQANLLFVGQDFSFQEFTTHWQWQSANKRLESLPIPSLALSNMAGALMVVEALQNKLFVAEKFIHEALATVELFGRQQIVPGKVLHLFDVAHNPASAKLLAQKIKIKGSGKIHAVFSMLGDKDIVNTVTSIEEAIDQWYIAPLRTDRAASKKTLADSFSKRDNILVFDELVAAYQYAIKKVKSDDTIVVFGSFYTVAKLYPVFQAMNF